MNRIKFPKLTKAVSLLLAIVITAGALPLILTEPAFAYTGEGTEADPYVVTDYAELKELMSTKETRYIKLGGDVISNDTLNINTLLVNGGNVILDLAGYTLKRTSSVTSDSEMISIIHGSLTIKDSSAGGTGQVISHLGQNSENLYISSGTDLITVDGAYAQLTIDGGTFTNEINYGYALNIELGTVTINGGTFIASYHKYGDSIPIPYSIRVDSEDAEIFINGGTFYYGMYFPGISNLHITNCIVTSGDFSPEAVIWIGNYASLSNALSYRTTVSINGVIDDFCNFSTRGKEIVITTSSDVGYTGTGTASDPMIVYDYGALCKVMREAPTDGSTRYIKLGCDITTSPRDVYDKSYCHDYAETVDSRQKVVLDINGKTLKRTVKESPDFGIFYVQKGELTILSSDGIGVINSNFKQTIAINGGKLTVGDGVFVTSEAENSRGIRFISGTLTVNGGIFDGENYGLLIYPSKWEDSAVIINGGTFAGGICVEGFDQSASEGTMLVRINNATVNGKAEFSTPGNEEGWESDIAEYTTVTVYDKNGKVKKTYKGSENNGRVIIDNDGYTIEFSSPEQVKDVLINSNNAFKLPKPGQTAGDLLSSIICAYADGKTSVGIVEWYDSSESGMKAFTGSFEAGKEYILCFTVTCDDEYVFYSYDKPDITVGGGLNYNSYDTAVGDRTMRVFIYFTVSAGKPVITKQPEDQKVYVGNTSAGTATFTVELENTYQAEYEWRAVDINGNVRPWESFDPSEGTVSGVNTDTLTISDIGFEYERGYSFYCVVSTPAGSVVSDAAKVEVTKDNNHTQTYNLNSSSTTQISESCTYDIVLDVGTTLNKNTYVWYKQVKVNNVNQWMPISILEENLELGIYSGYDKGQLRIETPSGVTTDVVDGLYRCTVTASDDSVTNYSAKVTVEHYFSDTCVDTGSDITHGRYCIYCGTRTDEEHKVKWIVEREATDEQAGKRFFVCTDCGYQSAVQSYQCVSGYYSHLTLDPNGGTIKNSTGTWETTPKENSIVVPTELLHETPAYEGHTFLGWSTDPDDTKPMYEPDEKVMLYGVITLYAIWEKGTGSSVYLERIDVSIEEPVKGDTKLSLHPVPLTEDFEYCLCGFVKYDSDGNWAGFLDENEPLESGKTYKLIIYAYIPYKPYNNKLLSKIVPYINGEEVTLDYTGRKDEYRVVVMYKYVTIPDGVRVSGTVTSEGNDRDDVTVSLIKDGETAPSFETVIIGNTAKYAFAGVTPGTYTLRAVKQDNITEECIITVGDENMTQDIALSLAPSMQIGGTLKTFGDMTEPVYIQLIPENPDMDSFQLMFTGDSEEYYIRDIYPGTYTLVAEKNGHVTRQYTVNVDSADTVQDIILYLRGDANEDGKISLMDVNRIIRHLASWSVEINLDNADYDANGKVNLVDVSKLIKLLAGK